MTRRPLAIGAALALSLGAAACGSASKSGPSPSGGSGGGSGAAVSINGAGSTFAAPIYSQWGSDLKSQGVTVNYQAVGSGAGVAALTSGTADFAGSDPAMKDSEIAAAKKKGTPVHFPMAFGAITAAYNVSGVKAGLKLDGATLADIFLGKVKTWNDPAIAKLNPGVKLPSTKITIVHRSDESGTTKGFTTFLAASSPEWKSKVGADKTVKWPTGTGAKGNDGVAGAVKSTPGAIGYVEQAYALQNNFTVADVKNSAGKFIQPSLASTTAAGKGITIPADRRISIIGSPNPDAYPISSQTFVIVYQDLCKAGLSKAKAEGVKKFIAYGLGQGQQVLSQLQYASLPAELKSKDETALKTLSCNGKPLS